MTRNKTIITKTCRLKGFTLIELVLVLVLLGVMAVGISGFMKLTTQTYINVSDRDELLSSARFVIERLNREIRDSVPNSARVKIGTVGGIDVQCLEFLPILASTIYTSLPVSPLPKSDIVNSVPFKDAFGQDYQCDLSCRDNIIVYPLSEDDVYVTSDTDTGKVFAVGSIEYSSLNEWTIKMDRADGVLFDQHSPTERAYFSDGPVSYCQYTDKMYRIDNYTLADNDYLFPPALANDYVLMAERLESLDSSIPIFVIQQSTLKRNSIVQINLSFARGDESLAFNQEVQILNVP